MLNCYAASCTVIKPSTTQVPVTANANTTAEVPASTEAPTTTKSNGSVLQMTASVALGLVFAVVSFV